MNEPDIKIPIVAEAHTEGFEEAQKAAEKTGEQVQQAAAQTIEPQRQAAEQIAETTRKLQEQQQAAAGGNGAESAPKDSGAREAARSEQELQKAREASAASAAKAGEASATLAKQREENSKAAASAAGAEKPLKDAHEEMARAAATAAEAQQEAAVTTEEEAARMRAIEEQMKLEAMARRELTAEVQRLAEARRAAAKAGDAQALQQLTAQYQRAKGVLTQMTQASNIQKAALMGQASAGMQLAASMRSLGEQASRGSTDIAGMASQVMSLGMALKAGLGPIGWVMMALQGLQAAFDAWRNKKTGDLNRELEETRRHIEALQKAWQQAAEAGEAQRNAMLDGIRQERQELQELQSHALQDMSDKEAQAARAAKLEDERKLGAAKQRYEIEKARIDAEKARGEISEEAAAGKIRALEDELRRAQQDVAQARERREIEAAEAQAEAMRQQLQDMETAAKERFGGKSMQKLLTIKMPAESEIKALELRLSEVDDAAEEAELRAANNELQEKIRLVKKLMNEMGVSTEGGYKAVAAFVRDMQAANKETQKLLTSKRREVGLAEAEVRGLQERLAVEDELREGAEETLAEQRKAEDARREAREREKKLREEWTEQQRKSLAEQEKWLAETASHFKEGSEEANRWAKELSNVRSKRVTEAVGEIEKQFKVTGNYVEQDSRTQAAIHAADKDALTARRAALEKLKAAPNVDASTLKAINQKIKDTDAQLRGLQQAMRQSAAEARQSVENLKPLGQKAKWPNLRGPLQRAEKAYSELAKRAARQAANGDEKGLERTLESMRRLALDQERWTGFTGKAAEHMKETEGKLRSILNNTAAQDRGLTAAQLQENKVLEQLGEKRKHTARAAAAAQKSAKAKEAAASADEKAAADAKKNAQQTAAPAEKKAEAAGQVNKEVENLRSQVARLESAQGDLTRNITSLAGAVANLAAAAQATASTAASAASATASALGSLKSKQESMQKSIDRILRKLQ